MKRFLAWTPLLALLLLIVVPHVAHAFSPLSGNFQIVPKECNDCPGSSAGWGCVLLLIKNLINFALSLGVLACVAVLAYAGGLWVLNPLKAEFREQGRGMLINAVVGLVIALAAWLIINTFTVVLTGKGVETWTAQIGIGDKCLPTASDVTGGGTANLGGSTAPNVTVETGNEASVRQALASAGITINKNACPSGVAYQNVPGGCTSVGGFQAATVNQIINVKNICGGVEITGGSELGHADGGASHASGSKVDLATNIDSCIEGGSGGYFSRSETRGSDARYVDKCGNEYVRETSPNHWDITVSRACSR
jgi:hypothetical protein